MKLNNISSKTLLKTPKAIIFDWDNTLVDTRKIIKIVKEETLSKFRTNISNVETSSSASSVKFFDAFIDDDQELAKNFFYEQYILLSKNIAPLSQAEESLKKFNELQIPIFIISNKKHDLLQFEINILNWQKYFIKIIGSNADSKKDKPSSFPVLSLLIDYNIPVSEDVWLIGDSDLDIKCAYNSGIYPILFGDLVEFDINNFDNDKTLLYVKNHSLLIEVLDLLKS